MTPYSCINCKNNSWICFLFIVIIAIIIVVIVVGGNNDGGRGCDSSGGGNLFLKCIIYKHCWMVKIYLWNKLVVIFHFPCYTGSISRNSCCDSLSFKYSGSLGWNTLKLHTIHIYKHMKRIMCALLLSFILSLCQTLSIPFIRVYEWVSFCLIHFLFVCVCVYFANRFITFK